MLTSRARTVEARRWVRLRPLIVYFGVVYLLSFIALAVIGLPKLNDASGPPAVALAMFPVMVIGVGLTGIGLTAVTRGRDGLREIRARLRCPIPRRWWALLLVPPAGIFAVLGVLSLALSSRFTPQFLVFGFAAGALAGFFEEFGWTGFAYPRMHERFGWLRAGVLLGLLWGVWHLPVSDALGAASPHAAYWPAFFAAFIALMSAVRVLIAWAYTSTGSLRLAQLMHASSTGFLVVLSAPRVSAAQEALWYAVYGALLWAIVGVVALNAGRAPAAARPAVGTVAGAIR